MSLKTIPEWILNSPYLIEEPEWHMSDEAPQEVKDKFNEWIKVAFERD